VSNYTRQWTDHMDIGQNPLTCLELYSTRNKRWQNEEEMVWPNK